MLLSAYRTCARLLIGALFLLGLAACSTLGQRDPLRIAVAGIEPLPGQGLEMRFNVKLRVQNPNDTAIDYNGLALDMDINGQPLASGVSSQSGSVPRYGETVLTVPVTVSAFSAVRQFWGFAEHTPTKSVPYTIHGKLAGGLLGTVRFKDKGELTLPESRGAGTW